MFKIVFVKIYFWIWKQYKIRQLNKSPYSHMFDLSEQIENEWFYKNENKNDFYAIVYHYTLTGFLK